eukprot:g10716.t1
MGGEEESSWLSIVIDRVDKLALTIGGYEDEAPEQTFSDDESDNASSSDEDEGSGDSGFEGAGNNGDDDDSGFEDAVVSPGRLPIVRPRAEKRVEDSEANDSGSGGKGKALKDMRHRLSLDRLPIVTSADKAPSALVPASLRSDEHLNLTDAQALEEAPLGNLTQEHRRKLAAPTVSSADSPRPVSLTPSHSQAPLPRQRSADGSFSATFSTPAHSRDRNASNRPPPLAAAPAGSGAGSRRVHRERHRNGEDLDETSIDGMPSAEEPAPVHASLSQTASHPLETVNHPSGSTKKKYSYVGDTTWLKPKEDFPERVPSLLELGTLGVRGECSQTERNTHSTPSTGSAPVPVVGTAGDAAALTAQSNQHGFPSEAEQKLGQDVLDEAIGKAEIDSQVEKRSEQALDTSGEDPEIHEDGGGQLGALDRAFPEDSFAVAANPDSDLPAEDDFGANGHDAPFEEKGALEVLGTDHQRDDVDVAHGEGEERTQEEGDEDALKPLDMWAKAGVTIGSKRASVGNGVGTQDLDWVLGSPEGLAPYKRGRTQPEHPLAVMRHSARLDDAIHQRQRMRGTAAAGRVSESLENGEGDELAAVPWPDRAQRPYDSPIVDTDLPARQAKELSRLGMDSETLILCSPFRRCLQTAGVVARTLGVANVTVHLEVGERMDKVRKEIAELAIVNEQESDGALGGKLTPVFSYLGKKAMREALGEGVELERIIGEQPPQEESGVEAKQRFISTIAKVREEKLRESPVLVVAHGDTLDAAGESLASQIVFEADYCAWALFDLNSHCGHVTESYGVQMIPL